MFKLLQLREEYSEDRDKTIFHSSIKTSRRNQLLDKKDNYKWGAPHYKIYPSGLTFSTCPVKYLRDAGKFTGLMDATIQDYARRGSSIHREYQEDFIKSSVIWDKNKINFPKELEEKFDKNWPEVFFFDPDTGVSGKADGVQNYKGKPLIIEMKTTSKLYLEKILKDLEKIFKSDEEFHTSITTMMRDKMAELAEAKKEYKYGWESISPESAHITQGCIYVEELRRLNYFTPQPDQFLLVYINTALIVEDVTKEFLIDYLEYEEETVSLLDSLAFARKQLIAGEEMECRYKYCKEHNPGVKRKRRKKIVI